MSPLPGRLVLLGHPVSHSLSPRFQNAALRAAGIPLRYEALDVAPDALATMLAELAAQNASGNVTIPHKEAVAALCTRRERPILEAARGPGFSISVLEAALAAADEIH